MKQPLTTRFGDLPGVVATIAPLMPPVQQCTIQLGRAAPVRLLLLPGGMFAPQVPPSPDLPSDDVLVALSRIAHNDSYFQGRVAS